LKRYQKIFLDHWKFGGQHVPKRCWGCYKREPSDIHHLKGRGMGGDPRGLRDDIYNLIPLCRSCHKKTDDNKEFNEMLKIRLRRFIDGD